MLKLLKTLLIFLSSPQMIVTALTFKVFSVTSYKMLHSVKDEKIDPAVIIDVGANKGQFAVSAANIFPNCKVFSFEPDPEVYSKLVKNTASYDTVTCFQTALGNSEGEIEFNRNSYSLSSSILPMTDDHLRAFPKATEKETISVPLTTLDTIANELELTRPVLLKLDVQGYEKLVLEGACSSLESIDFIILEASFRTLYEGEMLFSECLLVMREYGFEVIRPIGYLTDPKTEQILQMDLLFRNKRRTS